MSSSLTQLVTVFNGTGYQAWADQMMAYLDFQGPSVITLGGITCPEVPEIAKDKSNADLVAKMEEKEEKWVMQDKQARGAIYLRITPAIKSQVIGNTSKEVWDALKKKYGVAGLPVIFTDFKRAIQFQLSGNDPRPEISKLLENFDRLETNKVILPKFVKAMIFITALPPKYDNICSVMLAKAKLEEMNLQGASEVVVAEWECQTHGSSLNKMSNIKRKNKDPSFKQQRQQNPSNKPDQSSSFPNSNNQHGNSGGKKKKEKKAHKQQQHNHHHHNHAAINDDASHIASTVILGSHTVALAPHVPPQTSVSVASITPSGLSVQKRPVNLPTKTFTAQSAAMIEDKPTYSSWSSVAQAQQICDALGVTKSPNNLRRLEEMIMKPSSDRQDSPPPVSATARHLLRTSEENKTKLLLFVGSTTS